MDFKINPEMGLNFFIPCLIHAFAIFGEVIDFVIAPWVHRGKNPPPAHEAACPACCWSKSQPNNHVQSAQALSVKH